jgi:GDP-L-fucose synthase
MEAVGMAMVDLRSKIYIAGHRGLVGSALLRQAKKLGFENLIIKSRQELDLTDQKAVASFFSEQNPEYVFMAAAKVGGIWANSTCPAEFIYENITIQTNLIHQSYRHGVKKLLFLGSSCIYPKNAPQPMKEEYLLTGMLEPTNEPYAIAKIAGIKMCQAYNRQYGANFISVMPTNLYGPGDNYDLETSHVIAALIRKFHEAKVRSAPTVAVWGTGTPKREFLFVDDLADACFFLMQNYNESEIINIGYGKDITINSLAGLIKQVVGYDGNVVYDETKPDGVSQKILDTTKLTALGWSPQHDLKEGIKKAYASFKSL